MAPAVRKEAIWNAQGEAKRLAVQSMFADIAPTYDRVNGLISFSLHHKWREEAVRLLSLKEGDRVLDLCCGTGDFQLPLRGAVGAIGTVIGIDFCLPMIQLATAKKAANGLSLGDACGLPVQSQTLDAVTVGWGIRNVPDIDAAHQEIARVLKHGGKFVSLDMSRPQNPILGLSSKFAMNKLVPLIGRLFGKAEAYTYLPKSTERFYSREELAASMREAGLVEVGWKNLFFGNVCIHWGTKP